MSTSPSAPLPAGLPTRYRAPGLALRLAMMLLALAALGVSVYLLAGAMLARRGGSGLAGCGRASQCDQVLSGRWSTVLGAPVSGPAVSAYSFALVALTAIGWSGASSKRKRRAWMGLLVLAGSILAAAAWFIGLQWYSGAYCRWCLAAHVCGLTLTSMVLILAPIGRPRLVANEPADPMLIGPGRAVLLVAVGVALTALLAGAQVAFRQPTHKVVSIGSVVINLDAGAIRYPVLGPRNAAHVLVFCHDYTCPNCRRMHGFLNQARRRYGDQIAIAIAPVPLDSECNHIVYETAPEVFKHGCEYAQLAIAVWRTAPDKFAGFDEYLSHGDAPPPIEAARAKVRELIGSAVDNAADAQIKDFIAAQIQLNSLLRKKAREEGHDVGEGVPTLTVGPHLIIAGRPERAEDIFEAVEKQLGVKPVTGR